MFRPLAASPFGTIEPVPDWDDTHAITLDARPKSRTDTWIRNDLRVRTFQGLNRNGPSWDQVVRRITRDLHSHALIETLDCDAQPKLVLHRRCLPGCSHDTSAAFLYRANPF